MKHQPAHRDRANTTMTIENTFSEHPGFRRTFKKDHLTLGIFFPIEAFTGDLPKMQNQLELARAADEVGFAALWTRDVPVRDSPKFEAFTVTQDPSRAFEGHSAIPLRSCQSPPLPPQYLFSSPASRSNPWTG